MPGGAMAFARDCTMNVLSWGPSELRCGFVQVQKLTDKFVADIDSLGDAKEKELNKLIL